VGARDREGDHRMTEFVGRIALTIICLGLVVVIHELGHLVMALRLGVRVERFTVGFGSELFGWTSQGIRYSVCAIPIGGMVKLAGEMMEEKRAPKPDEFFAQSWYRRNLIALAGPVMNYVLAFVLFATVAGVWGILQPSDQPVIGNVVMGLPAEAAQLREGDRILQIDGKSISSWAEMAGIIHARPGVNLRVKVERLAGKNSAMQRFTVVLKPRRDPQMGIGLIGIVPQVDRIRPGVKGSAQAAVHEIKVWTLQPLKYLASKVRRWEGPKELSGPIGIAQMVTKATKEGMSYVVYLIAIISTGLGLFNLFPIPMLDGGHILLYTLEGLLRRPLSPRAMQFAQAIGLSVIATIFLYASYQDILRWRLGFWK
jgi:regulator of sigma E protease